MAKVKFDVRMDISASEVMKIINFANQGWHALDANPYHCENVNIEREMEIDIDACEVPEYAKAFNKLFHPQRIYFAYTDEGKEWNWDINGNFSLVRPIEKQDKREEIAALFKAIEIFNL